MTNKPFRFIVSLEEGEYHADCIDAGAIGVGATVLEALSDLARTLVSLAKFSQEKNLLLRAPATVDDEALFAALTGTDKPKSHEAAAARGVVKYGEMTLAPDRSAAATRSFDIEAMHFVDAEA